MNHRLALALKGAAMGMAEVVPGVSGGTVAFITGIYERLLEAITAFSPALFSVYREEGFSGVWTRIQGPFLINLLVGMLGGLIVGVFAISYLLEAYPPVVWSLFFGLILASVWYIGRQVEPWSVLTAAALLVGTGVALTISMGSPASGNEALWFVYLSGVIAISALLLPGVSGSFILLLLGMYSYIVPSVKAALSGAGTEAMLVVIVFALGCLTGLATISRVLSWLFERYPQPTLALLTGFMLGSLYKLWPWRVATVYLTDDAGQWVLDDEGLPKVVSEKLVLPAEYLEATGFDPMTLASVIAMLGGVLLIVWMARREPLAV